MISYPALSFSGVVAVDHSIQMELLRESGECKTSKLSLPYRPCLGLERIACGTPVSIRWVIHLAKVSFSTLR
jgi:hypothetical protein